MKNKKMVLKIVLLALFAFSAITCYSQSGGGRNFNNADDLKKYLDSQPANSPDKPIKVSMNANAPMLPKIGEVINSTGKYVSLNLTGNALTTIPERAFDGCETLVSITIPNNVTNIGERAFQRCTSLATITVEPANTAFFVRDGILYSATEIIFVPKGIKGTVTIPDGVTWIGRETFSNCKSITSVTISNSVTEIGQSAFSGCTSLASITIGSGVKRIEKWAFDGCTSLTSITFKGTISSSDFDSTAFRWMTAGNGSSSIWTTDLRNKYLAGGVGTYTTPAPLNENSKWTKQ